MRFAVTGGGEYALAELVFGPVKPRYLPIEALQYLFAQGLPVAALIEHRHEVITAHMTKKLTGTDDDFLKQAGDPPYDPVAFGIAVDIVVGLEMIQIEIGHMKFVLLLQGVVNFPVNGHIARQQRQRVGIAGVQQALFGNVAQQVAYRGQAVVLVMTSHNKMRQRRHVIIVGNQAAGGFQRGLPVHHDRVVHGMANTFIGIECPAIGAGKQLHDFFPAQHAHRHAVLQYRQRLQPAVGEQYLECPLNGDVDMHAAPGAGQHGHGFLVPAEGAGRHIGTGRAWLTLGVGTGPAQIIALALMHPHALQLLQLFPGFDALGNNARLHATGKGGDALHELALDRILIDILNEVAVYLHIVGLDFGPELESGIAGTEIVDGNAKAEFPIALHGHLEAIRILNGILL